MLQFDAPHLNLMNLIEQMYRKHREEIDGLKRNHASEVGAAYCAKITMYVFIKSDGHGSWKRVHLVPCAMQAVQIVLSPSTIQHVVPQASVLGVLLFNMISLQYFANDAQLTLFTDDTIQ